MTHENKMGTMPVRKLLMSMAWPAILSMTINAMYNVVDSIFVSRIGEDALTAVSLVNPIQMMIIAISVGSGVGINSLIARRLGAKNQEAADKAASTSIRIGLFNYLIFFVDRLSFLLSRLFQMCGRGHFYIRVCLPISSDSLYRIIIFEYSGSAGKSPAVYGQHGRSYEMQPYGSHS